MTHLKENNSMKKIKHFLKNKKGSFSILFVILAFIGIIVITATSDILRQAYVLNEVQGIMDVAGVSALNYSVDKESLRGEEFKYDEESLVSKYRDIVNLRINTGDTISYKEFIKTEVIHEKSSEGLGQYSNTNDQLWLKSVMLIRVKTSNLLDLIPSLEKNFYDSQSKGNFRITVNGQTEDGETELIIRSVSRLVYR
jgi:hypothetical protein